MISLVLPVLLCGCSAGVTGSDEAGTFAAGSSLLFAGAEESSVDYEDPNDMTMGEIKKLLDEYLSENGTHLNSAAAYYKYINDELLNHTDPELEHTEYYAQIHAFMVQYKNSYADFLLCKQSTGFGGYLFGNRETVDSIMESDSNIHLTPVFKTIYFELSDEFLSTTVNDFALTNNAANNYAN